MEGAVVGSQHSTEEVNKEAGGTSSAVQQRGVAMPLVDGWSGVREGWQWHTLGNIVH